MNTPIILSAIPDIADRHMSYEIDLEQLSIGDGVVTQKVFMGRWQDWTPVFTGFSLNPVVLSAEYHKVGRLVTARVELAADGSNATFFTMTLPIKSGASAQYATIPFVTNNGVRQTDFRVSNNKIWKHCFRLVYGYDMVKITCFSPVAAAGWTASGNKFAIFTVTYEAV